MTQEAPKTSSEPLRLTPEELSAIEKRVQRAEALADLLDNKYLDPLLGLWEGVGDAATALAGVYIIYEAKRLNVPAWELAKMLGRTTFDFLGGEIPFIGDIFDFFYKSNNANAEVLRKHFEKIRAEAETYSDQKADLIGRERGEEKRDLGRKEKPLRKAA